MAKKKEQKSVTELKAIEEENQKFTEELQDEIDNDIDMSLDVDPQNKYNMPSSQKEFIRQYCEFKSIPMAAELSSIDLDTAKAYFAAWSSQQEIRRINKAMYKRQFSQKLLSIDDLTGYLSSLITDENVPIADRVKTMDKVRIAQILIDLQVYKNEAIQQPDTIIDISLEDQLKNLSVNSIKALLNQKEKPKELPKTDSNLKPEEEALLRTLPTEELLKLIDSVNNEDKNDKENNENEVPEQSS